MDYNSIKRICIFCGCKNPADPRFKDEIVFLCKNLADRGIDLVYGGGTEGLMGLIANTFHNCGREVIGIIPMTLIPVEAHGNSIGKQIIVKGMHERKVQMYENSDAFLALPGGFGTMEELLEIITWFQLRLHNKPIAIYNIFGYYDGLISFINNAVKTGFIEQKIRNAICVTNNSDDLLKHYYSFTWN